MLIALINTFNVRARCAAIFECFQLNSDGMRLNCFVIIIIVISNTQYNTLMLEITVSVVVCGRCRGNDFAILLFGIGQPTAPRWNTNAIAKQPLETFINRFKISFSSLVNGVGEHQLHRISFARWLQLWFVWRCATRYWRGIVLVNFIFTHFSCITLFRWRMFLCRCKVFEKRWIVLARYSWRWHIYTLAISMILHQFDVCADVVHSSLPDSIFSDVISPSTMHRE